MELVKVGVVGLGRLGKHHAYNLAHRIPGARLATACSLDAEELQWAQDNLGVEQVYDDYQNMLDKADIEAVFLVSSTAVHPGQIIAALHAGKHVFCEKPLALEVEQCLEVERVARQHADKICMIGFVRRYDPSYYRAWRKVQDGDIGIPYMIYAQSCDSVTTAQFQISFAMVSGGLFLDMNIHDIDLIHWFSGSRIVEVTVCGGAYSFPEFAEYNDADNAAALCKMQNGSCAVIFGSRTAANGHATFTEIKGIKGELTIGRIPAIDRLDLTDGTGVRHECVGTFFERFQQGFLLEAEDYIDCILNRSAPRINLSEATAATRVAVALRESLQSGKTVTVN